MKNYIAFNIKFSKKDKRYFKVFIFNNRKEMHKAVEFTTGVKENSNYACMIGIGNKGQKWIGTLMFYRGYIGAGIVAHECLHAVYHLKDFISMTEEEDCLALEKLIINFWRKYYKYEQEMQVGW
jgi:hypothetical protein